MSPNIVVLSADCGFSWNSKDIKSDKIACSAVWNEAKEAICSDEYDLVVLDEINLALHLNYLQIREVVEAINKRPAWKHIIMTGRNAPLEIVEIADCVSDIKNIKHPFDRGIVAQKGIDF